MNHPDLELFERFRKLSLELRDTAAVVQNDHDRLISDGMITADDVRRNLKQFVERSHEHLTSLSTAMTYCIFDNPTTCLREAWSNGKLVASLSMSLIAQPDEIKCLWPAGLQRATAAPFTPGRIEGDPAAIQLEQRLMIRKHILAIANNLETP